MLGNIASEKADSKFGWNLDHSITSSSIWGKVLNSSITWCSCVSSGKPMPVTNKVL